MNIGIFDSGLGGLTILKECKKFIPHYNYIYLADNARVPYGDKPQEVIYEYTKEAIEYLIKKNCSLIIIACNTATTTSLRKLQQTWLPKYHPDVKVLGVTRPVMEAALETEGKRIGVIATTATVMSNSFHTELKNLKSDVHVEQVACPLLVPLIEQGIFKGPILEDHLKEYLAPLLKANIDTLILGCTHYGLVVDTIKTLIPSHIKIVAEGHETAKKLKDYLHRHPEVEKKLEDKDTTEIYVTQPSSEYHEMVKIILKHTHIPANHIQIAELGNSLNSSPR